MLSSTTVISVLLGLILIVLQESGSQSYQVMSSYPLSSSFDEHSLHRREHSSKVEDNPLFPRLASEIFGSTSQDSTDRNRFHEDNDSSLSSDENPMIEIPRQLSFTKRRKGPTLSVVNPLEILRQRLMLDMARRRIEENQKQINDNAQYLETIGKRSSGNILRQSEEAVHLLGDGGYRT